MFQNHYLQRWQAAGLLDEARVEAIRAWEASNAKPVWLYAIAGLGVFAVSLGVLAVIAANWEEIPASLKLGLDLLLTALVAGGVYVAAIRDRVWPRELLALLLFGLVIGGIALISQVFQLGGEMWVAMVVWVAVCTPFLALATRSGMAGVAWGAAVLATWIAAWSAIDDLIRAVLGVHRDLTASVTLWLLIAILGLAGQARLPWPSTSAQGRWLTGLSAATVAAAICLAHVTARFSNHLAGDLALTASVVGAAGVCMALPAGAALWRRERALAAYFAVGWVAWLAPLVVRFGSVEGFDPGDAVAALVFMAFWGFVGWMALRAGRRGLFGVAFAFAAGRMLVVYFEAFGGLSTTGFGLIGGGLLLLGLAWAGWWLSKRAGRTAAGATP